MLVCWVVGRLRHARDYMPSKISSSCPGPSGHSTWTWGGAHKHFDRGGWREELLNSV